MNENLRRYFITSDVFSNLRKFCFVMDIAKRNSADIYVYDRGKSIEETIIKYFLSIVESYEVPIFLNIERNNQIEFNRIVSKYENSKKKSIDNLLVISNGIVKSEKDRSIIAFDNGFSIVFEDFYNNPLMFQREKSYDNNTTMLKVFGNNKTPLVYLKVPSLEHESKLIKMEYNIQNTHKPNSILLGYLNI